MSTVMAIAQRAALAFPLTNAPATQMPAPAAHHATDLA
ncbi:hypothetical protein LUPAC06_01024 [Micromonospora saelicesensis]|nr:hypothetical protein LUPAC06_01024 [Micromonospora saelicesensis]